MMYHILYYERIFSLGHIVIFLRVQPITVLYPEDTEIAEGGCIFVPVKKWPIRQYQLYYLFRALTNVSKVFNGLKSNFAFLGL